MARQPLPAHLKKLLAEARKRGLLVAAQNHSGLIYNYRTPDECIKHWRKFGAVTRIDAYVLAPVEKAREERRAAVASAQKKLDRAVAHLETLDSYIEKSS